MGYAMFNQRTKGVHFRLFSRAYIIKHKLSGKTIVYVNMDLWYVQLYFHLFRCIA